MLVKKSFPFLVFLLCFVLQGCAGPSRPAVSQVSLREAPGGAEPRGEVKKDPAVKEVTLSSRPEGAAAAPAPAPSRKDSIRARFPGKKVVFPDELGLPDRKPEYRVGPDDVVSVLVWNQPDLTLPNVTVRKDGMLFLPRALSDPVLERQANPSP